MSEVTKFDDYLGDKGPAALVLRDELVSVEGPEGVIFPATFAQGDGFAGGYNIDEDASSGTNVCLIDSVGSQANRIEPLFGRAPYSALVPQIGVQVGDRIISLLEAGHRAGDAIVRCSSLQEELQKAFQGLLKGDADKLAKVAPTSLVFGVWDSRDTQAKAPRILASTIRAYDVRRLTRSAQYVPAVDYVGEELLEEPTDKATKDAYAQRGFVHVPATGSHGGVIAKSGVRRDATLSLAALRLLSAGSEVARTTVLRRYVFGLALVAFTANVSGYLRQGCSLVLDASKPTPRRIEAVFPSGERKPFGLTHDQALVYATAVASEFGVAPARTVPFEKERAKTDVAPVPGKKPKEPKGKKAKG